MHTTWSNGYQTEVNYTYGYYRDLSPNFQRFCLLLNGVDSGVSTDQHRHCELGFGQGVSINIHAAASEDEFWGTDFNPAHAAHARQLAAYSQVNHHFYDDSFEELLNRQDLPQFDSISLHGIWSWISYENQLIILKFIRQHLKPSGIVYVSYNCITGWAGKMPVRELFYSHFKYNSTSLDPIEKVKDALDFGEQLMDKEPLFAKQNPLASATLKSLKEQNPNYLIHEYLNQDWQCFSFQQVVRLFEDVKLSYAGNTSLLGHLDHINFNADQLQFLNEIKHPLFKEQCRDYFSANQFRRDLFVRGLNQLNEYQTKERLRATQFLLLKSADEFPTTIGGQLGSFNLIPEIYQPIAKLFKTEKYAALSIRQIEDKLVDLNYDKILNALVVLCHLGYAQPCEEQQPSKKVLQQSHALNHALIEQARFHGNYTSLISPMTGMGVSTNQLEQLFYTAYFVANLKTAEQIAEYIQTEFDKARCFLLDKQSNRVTERKESLKLLAENVKDLFKQDKVLLAEKLRLFN